MTKPLRVIYSAIFFFILECINYYITGDINVPTDNNLIWFEAGFLSLVFGVFLIEHIQTKPTDAIISAVALFFTTYTLKNPPYIEWWQVLQWLCGIVFLLSILLMSIEKSTFETNPIIRRVSRTALFDY
ncbi:hypothetical protein [Anaeroselena agilis]|uniref:Uncharacterized protein n=1 Tax=Anaeroselena agilis TaxID=3063788 RepID=A0ABU3NVC3_9FIRM|nr:hypothetical protein [Selenomonadales bacterium 4137-cl]